jgi:hypothetical protein
MSERFPDDHPCEALRGLRKPALSQALRAMAQRAAWIEQKLAATAWKQHNPNFLVRELAAIALFVELAVSMAKEAA